METDFYVLAELLKDYLGIVHSVKVRQGTTKPLGPVVRKFKKWRYLPDSDVLKVSKHVQ